MVGVVGSSSAAAQALRELAGQKLSSADASRARANDGDVSAPRDRVSVSGDIGAERLEALSARNGLDLAVGAGRQALSVLGEIAELSGRAAQADAPDAARAVQDQALRGLLTRLSEIVDNAIEAGARSLGGAPVSLTGGGDDVAGLDLRLGAGGAMTLSADASIATRADAEQTAALARDSFARVSQGLARMEEAAAGFAVHLKALEALDASLARSVQTSFDEDSARMIALQVRQTLSGLEQPIFNAGQGGILSHFKV